MGSTTVINMEVKTLLHRLLFWCQINQLKGVELITNDSSRSTDMIISCPQGRSFSF